MDTLKWHYTLREKISFWRLFLCWYQAVLTAQKLKMSSSPKTAKYWNSKERTLAQVASGETQSERGAQSLGSRLSQRQPCDSGELWPSPRLPLCTHLFQAVVTPTVQRGLEKVSNLPGVRVAQLGSHPSHPEAPFSSLPRGVNCPGSACFTRE